MKYYEMHEVVYRRLKNENVLSWDKSKTFEEMWSHSTNVYLEKFLTERGIAFPNLKVLDLGTGTGTSALFAAKNGSQAVGVEISTSAIEIAKENARKLCVNVEFIVGEVLELDLKKKFDVVVDSTILHCIVGPQDRSRFYNIVKRHMGSNSHLLVNIMFASGDMSSRFPKEYFPHRTLLSEEKQLKEFESHGFEIVEMEKLSKNDGGYDLVALLKVRE